MSDGPPLVAVKATRKEFYGLKHPTYGTPLDEFGEALWAQDANLTRMVQDGAIKVVEQSSLRQFRAEEEAAPEAPAPAPKKG